MAKAEIKVRVGLNKGVRWDEQPLGSIQDYVLAARLRVSPSSVSAARRRRGIAPYPRGTVERLGAVDAIGKGKDRDVAGDLGCSADAVRDARRRHGVSRRQPRIDAAPLGTDWDSRLAVRLGVSVSGVNGARRARGLARYAPERRCACGDLFEAAQDSQRFCSGACRDGARRGPSPELGASLAALRRELRRRSP